MTAGSDAPTSAERIAAALAVLAAFERRDLETMIEHATPEVELTTMAVVTGRRSTPYRGHEGLREYLADAEGMGLDFSIEVTGAHATGDAVVVLARIRGSIGGDPVDMPVTYVFRTSGRRISHAVVSADVDYHADLAAGLGVQPSRDGGRGEPAAAPLVLNLEADAESIGVARRAVDAYATALGLEEGVRTEIQLAVSEACTNVVLHAYLDRPEGEPRPMRLVASHRGNELVIDVEDEGRGMVPRPDSPGLGLGLVVMARVAARCTIVTPPDRRAGAAIHLEFHLT